MIGQILGAVAGPLIGGLFGGGKSETTTRVDYRRMVRDAEAAGFNPLTALRNGGAAGFSVTSSPALSLGDRIGTAVGNVANFLADFDPMADQKAELESQLVSAQIANLNASTYRLNSMDAPGSFNVPQGAAATVRAGGAELAASGALPPSAPEPQGSTLTNPWPKWLGFERSPWSHDAEAWEQAYGDIGGSILGSAVEGGQDAVWNFGVRPALWAHDALSPWFREPATKPRGTANTKYYVPWAR